MAGRRACAPDGEVPVCKVGNEVAAEIAIVQTEVDLEDCDCGKRMSFNVSRSVREHRLTDDHEEKAQGPGYDYVWAEDRNWVSLYAKHPEDALLRPPEEGSEAQNAATARE